MCALTKTLLKIAQSRCNNYHSPDYSSTVPTNTFSHRNIFNNKMFRTCLSSFSLLHVSLIIIVGSNSRDLEIDKNVL